MRIFQLFGEVSLKGGSDSIKQLGSLEQKAVQVGKSMRTAGAVMTAAGGAIVGTAAAMVNSWAKAGDEIHKAGQRTGFSADALSRWRVAAQRAGTDLNAVETGVKRMQRSIVQLGDGMAESTRSFDRLGLSLEDIQKLAPEDQMQLIMERMADIEDPTLKAATAQEIFGRSGTALLPVLEDGAEGLQELLKVAEETGEMFSEDGAKSAAEYQDAMRDMQGSIRGLVHTFAVELMPVFLDVINRIKTFMVTVRGWMENNQALVGVIARVVLVLGAFAAALGPPLMLFGQLLIMTPKIVGAIKAIGAAKMAYLPIIGAVTIAVVALIAAYDKLNSAVNKANEAQKRALDIQKDQEKILSHGRDMLEKYGDASVESLKKQEVAYEDAQKAANAFRQYEIMMRGQGEEEAAEHWRRRAEMYQEYADNHAERLTENTEAELETERQKNEDILESYGITVDQLKDLDEIRLEDFGEHADEIGEIIEKLKGFDDDYLEHKKEHHDELSAEQKKFVDDYIDTMGHLMEGNKKAALSGAISSIFNLLPWPASRVAARIVKPLITRMIPALAEGGTIRKSQPYMVGEAGPEIIRPPRGTEVIPLSRGAAAGGGGGTFNFHFDSLIGEVGTLDRDNLPGLFFQITQGLKQRIPEAIEATKRQGDLYRDIGGLS